MNALGNETKATSSNASSVQISIGAQRASAETDDAKKDGAKVNSEARAALDKDGLSATGAMSGRALAIVGLNQDGTFSRAEVDSAKAELRERDRQSVLAFFNSGELECLVAQDLRSATPRHAAVDECRRAGIAGERSRTCADQLRRDLKSA